MVHSTVPAELVEVQTRSSWEMSPEQQDAARRAEASWRVVLRPDAPDEGNNSSPSVPMLPIADTNLSPSGDTGQIEGDSRQGQNLTELLDRWPQGFAVLLLGLAFFFGAAHAMTPGHGKTMVAAYLVGERGTLRHAVGLGLTTSLTHTGSVLVVALLLRLVSPDLRQNVSSRFSLASGLLVASLGAWLFCVRLRDRLHHSTRDRMPGGEGNGVRGEKLHHYYREAASTNTPGWIGLVTLGVSGGVVPCWDAVSLLFIAWAKGELASAFYLLLSFSAGLAATLVCVGILAVTFRGYLSSRLGSGRIVRALPVASAATILAIGLWLCVPILRAPRDTAARPSVSRTAEP